MRAGSFTNAALYRRPDRVRFLSIPIALLGCAIMLTAGCRSTTSEDAAPESAPTPVLLVTAEPVRVAPIKNEFRVLGKTVAMRRVTIRSPAPGRVIGVSLKNGDLVRRGQVVAYVLNRETEAAQAGLDVARRLDPQDAASLANSVDRYSKGRGIPIVAPESGIVAHPPLTSGQIVADLDPIVELVDPASIYVEASVPAEELHLVAPGMSAAVTSPLRPGFKFETRVAAVIPTFDAGSETVPVRLDFVGGQHIDEVDAPVQAEIVSRSVPDALVIPASALFQDAGEGHFHVFVADAHGVAHRTDVTVGIREGDRVQIVTGLKAGEQVITSGGYALSDGLRVRIAGNQS